MLSTWRKRWSGYVVLFAVVLSMPVAGNAGEGRRDTTAISYEFAHWFGSGLYRVDDRDVWNILIPLKKELREPADGRVGMTLLLPVTIGWLETGTLRADSFQTFTFAPGLELRFQPTPQWSLRPFVQVGVGGDLASGENGWVYAGGVTSRFETKLQDFTLMLGNAVILAGSQGGGNRSSFTRIDAGVGVEHPLRWRLGHRGTKLGAFYVFSLFSDDAELVTSPSRVRFSLGEVHQFGLSLGVTEPFEFLGIELDWLGVTYVTGRNIKGIRLNVGFPRQPGFAAVSCGPGLAPSSPGRSFEDFPKVVVGRDPIAAEALCAFMTAFSCIARSSDGS